MNNEVCEYFNNRDIYAYFGSINSFVGKGTLDEPINLMRASEVDWD